MTAKELAPPPSDETASPDKIRRRLALGAAAALLAVPAAVYAPRLFAVSHSCETTIDLPNDGSVGVWLPNGKMVYVGVWPDGVQGVKVDVGQGPIPDSSQVVYWNQLKPGPEVTYRQGDTNLLLDITHGAVTTSCAPISKAAK